MQLLQDSDLIGRSDEHRNRMSEVRVSPIYYTSRGDETTCAAVKLRAREGLPLPQLWSGGSCRLRFLLAAAPVFLRALVLQKYTTVHTIR